MELTDRLTQLEEEAEILRNEIRNKNDLALKDSLTGVYNRAGYEERILELFARWQRSGADLSIVFIDCNRFKEINDSSGHDVGDSVLVAVARGLRASLREEDTIIRFGGDEFVVVLADTNQEEGRVAGNRFVAAIREVGMKFDAQNPVTASAGLSIARPGDTVASVLKRADDFAYSAKGKGGNRLCG